MSSSPFSRGWAKNPNPYRVKNLIKHLPSAIRRIDRGSEARRHGKGDMIMMFYNDIALAQAIVQDRLRQAEQRRMERSYTRKQEDGPRKLAERAGNILIAVGQQLQRTGVPDTSTA
jgi:hypothetical protein